MDHDLTPLHRETVRVETVLGFGSKRIQLELARRGPMMAVAQSLADGAASPLRKAFSVLDGLADDVPFEALRAGVYGEISRESVQSMHRAGLRFTNTLSVNHSLNRMSSIAPKRDEYVWDDGLVKMARDAGIEVVMCLSKYYPKWARVPGKTYPTVEAWREFVSKVTAHYRDQIRYWMMVDEPSGGSGGRIPPEHYQRMVAAGYEAAHQADAENRVLMHGDLPKFFEKVIASAGGRHDFYDILAGGANNWKSAAPQVEAARREGKGVWAITFCGKASLYDDRPTNSSAARLPKWFVERLSVLRTTKFMNYTARVSGPEPGAYATSMSMYEFDGAFRPAGITYAVAGNLLVGTEPLGPLAAAEGVACHLFGAGTKAVAALWTDGRVSSCRLPIVAGVRCVDMTGTPRPPRDEADGRIFMLDSRPLYLVGGPGLGATLTQMQTDPVVRVQTEVTASPKGGRGTLTILIRNEMAEPFEGRATLDLRGAWFCLMGNRREHARTRSLRIKPGATAKIELPCLSHKDYPLRGYRLGLSLSCKQFTTELRDLPVEQ